MEEEIIKIESEKLSKINSAALINLRLTNLWIDANNHSRKGEYSSWNADLDCVWRELGGDTTKKGEEPKDFMEITKRLSKVSPLSNWKSEKGFAEISKDDLTKQNKQYQLLMEKELFLRRLQNKQGKGTAYEDDDDFE